MKSYTISLIIYIIMAIFFLASMIIVITFVTGWTTGWSPFLIFTAAIITMISATIMYYMCKSQTHVSPTYEPLTYES